MGGKYDRFLLYEGNKVELFMYKVELFALS